MTNHAHWRTMPARQMDYDLLQAIRDELSPLQSQLSELTRQVNQLAAGAVTRGDMAEVRAEIGVQMTRIETRYYTKELIDVKLGAQDTTIGGLKSAIDNLTTQLKDRPTRVLNTWVGIIAIIGGSVGMLSFLIQHLGLH